MHAHPHPFAKSHYYSDTHQNQRYIDRSPFNQQVDEQRSFKPSGDLKDQLNIVLKHNSQLLNENAMLGQMVNSLRLDISMRIEDEVLSSTHQLTLALEEMKLQQNAHDNQIARLLAYISQLRQDCLHIELSKNKELSQQKEAHKQQIAIQITQSKRNAENDKQIVETQLKNLKETLGLKDFQYESLKEQTKIELENLREENSNLMNELKKQNRSNYSLSKQQIRQNQQKLLQKLKKIESESNIVIEGKKAIIQLLKEELSRKSEEPLQKVKGDQQQEPIRKGIEKKSKIKGKIISDSKQLYDQLEVLKKEKLQTEIQLQRQLQILNREVQNEKKHLKQLANMEREAMETILNQERQIINGGRDSLTLLCEEKSKEIKRIYAIIQAMQQANRTQKQQQELYVVELRKRLQEMERSHQEELELLKVKMGILHQTDVQSLTNYYQNQMAALSLQIQTLTEAGQDNRAKINKLLQDNDEARHNYEIELEKYKAKIKEIKVQQAAAKVKLKEQLHNVGMKLELTSQTLLRETEQKIKGAQFFQVERQKMQQMILSKNRQIDTLEEAAKRQRKENEEECKRWRQQVSSLKESIQQAQQKLMQTTHMLEIKYQSKNEQLLNLMNRQHDEQLYEQNKQLREQLQNMRIKIKQINNEIDLKDKNIILLQENLYSKTIQSKESQQQYINTMQNDNKRIYDLMQQKINQLKQFYDSKIYKQDQDNQSLKQQLNEKEVELRALMKKYNNLENKLRQLLAAQQKLRGLEEKIIHLGMDQNLVKNMAELFSRHYEPPV